MAMVELLTTYHHTPFVIPSFEVKRSSQKELLQQKINRLRQRMSIIQEQTNTIQKEQEEIHQTARVIQKDQEEMSLIKVTIEIKQKEIEKKNSQIHKDQAFIYHVSLSCITLKWNEICRKAVGFQESQSALHLKLKNMKRRGQEIHQIADRIHEDARVMKLHLEPVAQIESNIQQRMIVIQTNQESMQLSVRSILEKYNDLSERFRLLRPALKAKEDHFSLSKEDHFSLSDVGKEKISHLHDRNPQSFWVELLNKMIKIGAMIMASVNQAFVHAQQYMKSCLTNYQWALIPSIRDHAATWVMLGTLKAIGLNKIRYSFFT